jgi:hypothetical protein
MMLTARDTGSSGSLRGSFLDLGGWGALGIGTPHFEPEELSNQDCAQRESDPGYPWHLAVQRKANNPHDQDCDTSNKVLFFRASGHDMTVAAPSNPSNLDFFQTVPVPGGALIWHKPLKIMTKN